MDRHFWLERWRTGRIGFQQEAANPYLARYWNLVGAPASGIVFVPLAGKSVDMRWLAERGHEVIGVELSDIAVRAFFEEWGVEPDVRGGDGLRAYSSATTTLYRGDFFDLKLRHLGGSGVVGGRIAVYDRASLISMPKEMRERYAQHLLELLAAGRRLTGMLLVTLEYPQEQMEGPPFSVDQDEVHTLFGPALQVERLCRDDVLDENERFRDRGLSQLHECVYALTPAVPS